MIKVPKECISAYHFPQSAALLLKLARSSQIPKYLSQGRMNTKIATISEDYITSPSGKGTKENTL
jgi:hypothetical protein